jgi:uncharacterized UBP type Zn finger protein
MLPEMDADSTADATRLHMKTLLDSYFQDQILELRCEKCDCQTVQEQACLKRLPKVLILHVKRFQPDYKKQTYVKRNDRIITQQQLDMTQYTREGKDTEGAAADAEEEQEEVKTTSSSIQRRLDTAFEASSSNWTCGTCTFVNSSSSPANCSICNDARAVPPASQNNEAGVIDLSLESALVTEVANRKKCQQQQNIYKLQSIVQHRGTSAGGGHYVTVLRDDINKTKWKQYNDSIVSDIPQSQTLNAVAQAQGYIFFYVLPEAMEQPH